MKVEEGRGALQGPSRVGTVPDLVQLLLVPEERVVAAVLALTVLGLQVAPPGTRAAAGLQGLTGGHIGCPEAVPSAIAQV